LSPWNAQRGTIRINLARLYLHVRGLQNRAAATKRESEIGQHKGPVLECRIRQAVRNPFGAP
jgi:hypothetical protein